MQLTWYGHAAFLLEGNNQAGDTRRVALDPYRAPDVGTYAPIDDTADIVAISHINEKYHSHTEAFKTAAGGDPVMVDGLALLDQSQPQRVGEVPFTAVRVWENDDHTEPIAMVGVTLGGVHLLHMGDCGHAIDAETVAACGKVDVLLALAGAGPTLALDDLVTFIHALQPRIVIPMHFGNDKINLNLRPIEEFLALMPSHLVRHFETSTVNITPETLPAQTEIWVLPPAR